MLYELWLVKDAEPASGTGTNRWAIAFALIRQSEAWSVDSGVDLSLRESYLRHICRQPMYLVISGGCVRACDFRNHESCFLAPKAPSCDFSDCYTGRLVGSK